MGNESVNLQDIKQIEEYIEKEGKFLSKKTRNDYHKLKKQSKQHELTDEKRRKYHQSLEQFKVEIIVKYNSLIATKQNEALSNINEQAIRNNDRLVTIIQEIKNGQEAIKQCNGLLSKQSKTNKMLFLFSIFAAVFTTALICYAIFSHPSYVLDSVTAKQGITGLVNSAI